MCLAELISFMSLSLFLDVKSRIIALRDLDVVETIIELDTTELGMAQFKFELNRQLIVSFEALKSVSNSDELAPRIGTIFLYH